MFSPIVLRADDSDDATTATTATSATADSSARYGLFDRLDHRSSYGNDVFPEPLLVNDSNLEENEARLEWFQSRAGGHEENNVITAELAHGFGNVTLELAAPYEIDKAPGQTTHGWDDIETSARCPLFEAVAPGGFADTTFGAAVEAGIPVNTVFGKNTELVPEVFNDTRFGNFTIQSIFGFSMLFGGGDNGGLRTFEYGFTLGYAIKKPCPGVEQFTPVFELSGEKEVNKAETNSITASVGFRVGLKAIGRIEPRLGVGYVFPMNKAAFGELQSGVYTMLVFNF